MRNTCCAIAIAVQKWDRARSLVRKAVPLMKAVSPKRAAQEDGKAADREEAEGEHQAKEVMFNIALNIIRWKRNALRAGSQDGPQKEGISLAPKAQHWKSLRHAAKATSTSRKTIKIAGAEWVIDGRLERPSLSRKINRKKSLRRSRKSSPGAASGKGAPQTPRAPLHELLRLASFKAVQQNMYRGSRATTTDLAGKRRANFKAF